MTLSSDMTEQEILDHWRISAPAEDLKGSPVQRLSPLCRRRNPCRQDRPHQGLCDRRFRPGAGRSSIRRSIRWCVSKPVSFGAGWSAIT